MGTSRNEKVRADRREARGAVREARRATKLSKKLAKSLTDRRRLRMVVLTDVARALTRAAEHDVRERPLRAKRLARKASAQLERAAIRAARSSRDELRRAETRRSPRWN